jgi:hypothetical protein
MPLLFINCYILLFCQAPKTIRQVPAGHLPGGLQEKKVFFCGKSRF